MAENERAACENCGWEGSVDELDRKEVKHPPYLSKEQIEALKIAKEHVEVMDKKIGEGFYIYLAAGFDKITDKYIERQSKPTYTMEEHCPKCDSYEDIVDPDLDPHLGCYSYPNCDIDPNGCTVLNGADAEPYGHRDQEI